MSDLRERAGRRGDTASRVVAGTVSRVVAGTSGTSGASGAVAA